MLETYEERTVLIVDKVNGEEEVPTNVQAIIYLNPISGSHPDVLAHVSVRARTLKVMLSVVFDASKCDQLVKCTGKHILLTAETSNSVKFEIESTETALKRRRSSHMILQQAIDTVKNLKPPPPYP